MRRSAIKAGVVYGMTPRHRRQPVPVVFLQDGSTADLYTWRAAGLSKAAAQGRPFASADGRSRGLVAVTSSRPEDLEGLDCPAELARAAAGAAAPSREALEWTLVTSLARVTAPWPDAIAAYEQREASNREEGDRFRAQMAAVDRQLEAAASALAVLGITPARLIPRDGGTVEIPAAQAELLAALALQAAPSGLPGIPPGVTVRPLRYVASALPLNHEDAPLFTITVDELPGGTWAVRRYGRALSTGGTWDPEPHPRSDRGEQWLAAHGFPLGEAIALAARHAPGTRAGGVTAAAAASALTADSVAGLAFPGPASARPPERRPGAHPAGPATTARPAPAPGT